MAEAPVDIAIFARAPVPGLCKTRLIATLGAAGAARLHRRMALRTVHVAKRANLGDVTLWCAPDTAHRFFRAVHRCFGVALRAQAEGDLGARMAAAFARAGSRRPLLAIGTDCPVLDEHHLQRSADALRQGQAATLLPAEDGGYVLIGLRHDAPEVFERIDWSSEHVLAQTRERLRRLGLAWHEGETLWDVDRPADVERLDRLVDGRR
ncbi:MAG: TIGR04282 family arsenosugar biosynthesis glycosyltransferase [Caldimonas sp.]